MEDYIEVQKSIMLSISFFNKGISDYLEKLLTAQHVGIDRVNKKLTNICKVNNIEFHNLNEYKELMNLDISLLFRLLNERDFVLNLIQKNENIEAKKYYKNIEELRIIRNHFAHPKFSFTNDDYIKIKYLLPWVSGPIKTIYHLFDYKAEEVDDWENSLLYFSERPEEIIPISTDVSSLFYKGQLMFS
jgi:hypothetical protein